MITALGKQLSDDNTKPSRVKRRLKRRWKRFSAQGLLAHGLTQHDVLTYISGTGKALSVGRENLLSIGVKPPRTIAVFLCLPFCKALSLHSIMAGCFGQLNGWLATNTQHSHPTTPRHPSREKLARRFISYCIGVTA